MTIKLKEKDDIIEEMKVQMIKMVHERDNEGYNYDLVLKQRDFTIRQLQSIVVNDHSPQSTSQKADENHIDNFEELEDSHQKSASKFHSPSFNHHSIVSRISNDSLSSPSQPQLFYNPHQDFGGGTLSAPTSLLAVTANDPSSSYSTPTNPIELHHHPNQDSVQTVVNHNYGSLYHHKTDQPQPQFGFYEEFEEEEESEMKGTMIEHSEDDESDSDNDDANVVEECENSQILDETSISTREINTSFINVLKRDSSTNNSFMARNASSVVNYIRSSIPNSGLSTRQSLVNGMTKIQTTGPSSSEISYFH